MSTRFPAPAVGAATVALLLAACGGSAAAPAATGAKVARTKAGLKRASWGTNVRIAYGKRTVRYRSNGIPDHARPAQYALPDTGTQVPDASSAHAADDPTTAQSYDFRITTRPRRAAKTTSTSLGAIGVMISGAVLFNPYEGDGSTVATASNFTVKGSDGSDVAFLDDCNGHPTPMGVYHYHALPTCVTAKIDKPKGPSHLLGIAFDGYPIYGDRDLRGRKVRARRLDRCNGLTSATPEFPRGIYHYVLLDTATSRSSIRCLRGKVSSSPAGANGMAGMGGPPGPGGPPPATAARAAFVCHLGSTRRA